MAITLGKAFIILWVAVEAVQGTSEGSCTSQKAESDESCSFQSRVRRHAQRADLEGTSCEVPPNKTACKQAAEAQGLQWDGTRNWTDRLPGCLLTTSDNNVNWNKNENGQDENDAQTPLCITNNTLSPDQFNGQVVIVQDMDWHQGACYAYGYGYGSVLCYKIDVGNSIQASCQRCNRYANSTGQSCPYCSEVTDWDDFGTYDDTLDDKQNYVNGTKSDLSKMITGPQNNCSNFNSTLQINSGSAISIQVQASSCDLAYTLSIAPTPAPSPPTPVPTLPPSECHEDGDYCTTSGDCCGDHICNNWDGPDYFTCGDWPR